MIAENKKRRREPTITAENLRQLASEKSPHSPEAEKSLLGAMILNNTIIGDVLAVLRGPEDFYMAAHAAIYAAVTSLYDRNALGNDLVPLVDALRDADVLEPLGGVDYLIEIAEASSRPELGPAMESARIIRAHAMKRGLLDAAARIIYDVHTGDGIDSIMDRAEKSVFDVAESRLEKQEPKLAGELIAEAYDMLAARIDDGIKLIGLRTNYFMLDDMLCGFQNGEMIIIAARPSIGKTAFMLNLAEQIAFNNRQPVGIFSMEMGRLQLAERLMSSRAHIDSQKMRHNQLTDAELAELQRVVGECRDAPMLIDDTPGLTITQLRATARRMVKQIGVRAIFIDYLQLMSAPSAERREQEVSQISRGIKSLARELNIPVIILAQLNRNPEGRSDNRPRLSDLRESGSLEQDADVVMLLHREAYYHKEDTRWATDNADKLNLAEVIVAKQRNGPVGVVPMSFDGHITRFGNRSHIMGMFENETAY